MRSMNNRTKFSGVENNTIFFKRTEKYEMSQCNKQEYLQQRNVTLVWWCESPCSLRGLMKTTSWRGKNSECLCVFPRIRNIPICLIRIKSRLVMTQYCNTTTIVNKKQRRWQQQRKQKMGIIMMLHENVVYFVWYTFQPLSLQFNELSMHNSKVLVTSQSVIRTQHKTAQSVEKCRVQYSAWK